MFLPPSPKAPICRDSYTYSWVALCSKKGCCMGLLLCIWFSKWCHTMLVFASGTLLAMWSKWLPFCCCFDFYRKRLHMVAQFFVNCSMLHPPQAFCCCSYHHFRIKNSRWDLILSYHHPNQQVDVTQRHGTTHHITSLPNVFLNDPDWSGRTARVGVRGKHW